MTETPANRSRPGNGLGEVGRSYTGHRPVDEPFTTMIRLFARRRDGVRQEPPPLSVSLPLLGALPETV